MTITQLRNILDSFRSDCEIVIDDADTNWLLLLKEVSSTMINNKPYIILSASYNDRVDKNER